LAVTLVGLARRASKRVADAVSRRRRLCGELYRAEQHTRHHVGDVALPDRLRLARLGRGQVDAENGGGGFQVLAKELHDRPFIGPVYDVATRGVFEDGEIIAIDGRFSGYAGEPAGTHEHPAEKVGRVV
jgi:hypothetical protein